MQFQWKILDFLNCFLHSIWSFVHRLHTCDKIKWKLANNEEVSEWTFCKNLSMSLTLAWLVYNFPVIRWGWRQERDKTWLNLHSSFGHYYSEALTFHVESPPIEGKYANLYFFNCLLHKPFIFYIFPSFYLIHRHQWINMLERIGGPSTSDRTMQSTWTRTRTVFSCVREQT